MILLFLLCSLITHQIVNMEFEVESGKKGLKDFVLPAIISVFFWMVSISYLVLSLALLEEDSSSAKGGGQVGGDDLESTPYFKDQNLESARNLMRQSLRRRLDTMDRRSRVTSLPYNDTYGSTRVHRYSHYFNDFRRTKGLVRISQRYFL